MELEHFSHDHPLMLNTEHTDDDGGELFCYGCEQPISDSFYGCKRCMFFLHKLCAELPREMTHPHHPLTLLQNPPSHYYTRCCCDVCRDVCNRFIYHCAHCRFDVDIKCASVVLSIQGNIQHPSHTHPLIPLEKPSMFVCDACGTKHEGASYLCTTCGFWINQKCAESPPTIKLDCHYHTLSLVYSIPNLESCKICSKKVYRRSWVYCCSECYNYVVHRNCATSEIERFRDDKTGAGSHELELNPVETDFHNLGTATSDHELSKIPTPQNKAKGLDGGLIYLPALDESVDMITQFIENIRIYGKYKEATEIKHACHEQPLTFSDKEIYRVSCSTNNLPLLNEVKNDEKCNGCALRISSPFYYCAQCSFFLHEWCAELPDELRHSCHPEHPLVLTSNIFVLDPCECCKLYCNGFVFTCFTCGFTLDSKCASLPRVIKHEAHKYTLALSRMSFGSCTGCDASSRLAFECQGCEFILCISCALLPRIVSHRYDEHPFILTYFPLAYQTDRDLCEICEEEIDSKHWFYHCTKCDQYLHTKCILPVDEFSNIKYGNTGSIEYHPDDSIGLARATSNFQPSRDGKAITKMEDFHPILMTLPFSNEFVDPITQIVKDLGLQGKYNEVREIKHVSHEHKLIKNIDGELNDGICNGCAETLSAPFFRCDRCNYSLHQWCAELPNEMQHPCHPQHPLLFTANSDPYKCQCCNSLCIAFGFRCSTCEFSLDSMCASLPHVIRHEAHKHTLALNLRWPRNCCSCGASFCPFAYVCSPCNFKLCLWCALLPRTIVHGFGKHFTLTYPPLKDQACQYDCQNCVKEINPRFWFYICDDVETSLHTDCFRSPDPYSKRNRFTLTVRTDDHAHLLLSVEFPRGFSKCHHCSQYKRYHLFVYECRLCDFWMHDHCIRALLFAKSN